MRAFCPTNSHIFLSDCSYEVSRGGNLVNGCKCCLPEGSKTEGQPLYSEGVYLDSLLSYITFVMDTVLALKYIYLQETCCYKSDSRTETYGIMSKKSVTCRDRKMFCILSKMSLFLR